MSASECKHAGNRLWVLDQPDSQISRVLTSHKDDPTLQYGKTGGVVNWPFLAQWKSIIRHEAAKRGLL